MVQINQVYEAVANSTQYAYIVKEDNPSIYQELNFGGRPFTVRDGQVMPPVINKIVFGYADNYTKYYDTFTAKRGLSVHFLINSDGNIAQLVDPALRAWYGGTSPWDGQLIYDGKDCEPGSCKPKLSGSVNDNGIGIWLTYEGSSSNAVFTLPTIDSTAELAHMLMSQYNIPQTNILSYDDGRIDKDGRHIEQDWQVTLPFAELASRGIGIYPDASNISNAKLKIIAQESKAVQCVQIELRAFGYQLNNDGSFTYPTSDAIRVFHKHFNQAQYKANPQEEEWSEQDQYIITELLKAKYGQDLIVFDCFSISPEEVVTSGAISNFITFSHDLP